MQAGQGAGAQPQVLRDSDPLQAAEEQEGKEMTGNSVSTGKKPRGKGKPFTKGDPRINRNGAPRVGLSWREILDEIGNLDGSQALERAGRIFAELKKYPNGVTLKELAAISYFIRMINDPNGSLLTAVADRTDGKVTEPIDLTTKGEKIGTDDDYKSAIIRKLSAIASAGNNGGDTKQPDASASGETLP